MAKGLGKKRLNQQNGGASAPPVPPIDPDNAEFVLFIRAKKFPQWYPLSIVKGGTAANMMVKAMESDLGKKMYAGTLVRNIGGVIYKDRRRIEAQVKTLPALKAFKEFEYGFKIRDKENPKNWYIADSTVQLIPPEDQLPASPVDGLKDAVAGVGESVQKAFKDGFKLG